MLSQSAPLKFDGRLRLASVPRRSFSLPPFINTYESIDCMKETKTLLKKVCEAIEDKKGENILVLDISTISSFTDFFVICHGFNARHRAVMRALASRPDVSKLMDAS